ncbi:MAG: type II toxin-antitoxin system death-on-curing family toxin [Edaphobacter sp.]|uniref:type II toxin-antitoxin system death-on-curing family toxin n=1 Tax=Edaphobacter sp. TaxID=1934404 RepID=UPI002394025D|nr:type II toxin-antitoxin system death-on-curing family toxin [Edaphobacter sp.]MDE1176888.1 type II toxin-antitoxin system death-on-curing family toxin [Edaphobacter sp.]
MNEPIWIEKPETLIAHSRQLAEHGGADGIRDEGLIESALGKPRNVFAYETDCDLPRLAASYAYGIARNHPFVDGNKRTALVVSVGFLLINGLRIVSTPEEKYFTFLGLADGTVSEEQLAQWFRTHAQAL